MKILPVVTLTMAALGVSGCSDAGWELAMASVAFAQCRLEEGAACQKQPPAGTTFQAATLTRSGDAVRVRGVLKDPAACESFVRNARPLRPDVVVQAVVNNTVVKPYGDAPLERSITSACATGPYDVSVTVGKPS
ncbi:MULTISPECIES: hypothetical protein [unclassified Cupriavidus]|uniref:hypothetical protein n=1 Tax=unclassified Cupriavidus TaxID=2640874 RepID=UPI0010FA4136|nr:MULTISPECIES: hypothetical protein [unclassified Cupriavidus]MWL92012.1 hypothetical protein [Cupriavidus sp. SW-Y-13]